MDRENCSDKDLAALDELIEMNFESWEGEKWILKP